MLINLLQLIVRILQWVALRTVRVHSPGRFVIDTQYRRDVIRWTKDPALIAQAKRIEDYFEGPRRDKTPDVLWAEEHNWEGIPLHEKNTGEVGFYIVYGDGYKWVNVDDIPMRPVDDN